jgi:hypothetical protein
MAAQWNTIAWIDVRQENGEHLIGLSVRRKGPAAAAGGVRGGHWINADGQLFARRKENIARPPALNAGIDQQKQAVAIVNLVAPFAWFRSSNRDIRQRHPSRS